MSFAEYLPLTDRSAGTLFRKALKAEESSLYVAWWLAQLERMDFSFGDTVVLVGESYLTERVKPVLLHAGASDVRQVSLVSFAGAGSDAAAEQPLEPMLGRCHVIAPSPAPVECGELFSLVPRWGSLLIGATRAHELSLMLDLYRDIHRRGITLLAPEPWLYRGGTVTAPSGLRPDEFILRAQRLLLHRPELQSQLTRTMLDVGNGQFS